MNTPAANTHASKLDAIVTATFTAHLYILWAAICCLTVFAALRTVA